MANTEQIVQSFVSLEIEDVKKLRTLNLTGTTYRLLLYLLELDAEKREIPNQTVIAEILNVTRQSVNSAVNQLRVDGFWKPHWGRKLEQKNLEAEVRDRLHRSIGGLKEVLTPVGVIDLLTNSEVIEIKHWDDWKAALGQVLAYSAYYPQRQKRIHLFYIGHLPKAQIQKIENFCSELGFIATFEEIEG